MQQEAEDRRALAEERDAPKRALHARAKAKFGGRIPKKKPAAQAGGDWKDVVRSLGDPAEAADRWRKEWDDSSVPAASQKARKACLLTRRTNCRSCWTNKVYPLRLKSRDDNQRPTVPQLCSEQQQHQRGSLLTAAHTAAEDP